MGGCFGFFSHFCIEDGFVTVWGSHLEGQTLAKCWFVLGFFEGLGGAKGKLALCGLWVF